MRVVIGLVHQNRYDDQAGFEERLILIKRIPAASGGWGLPGIEVSSGVSDEEIQIRLKNAIEAEMKGLIIPQLPKFVAEIDHEGRRVLIYRVEFVGRPQRDFNNPAESAVFADLSPYRLTDLAQKALRKLPRLPALGEKYRHSHKVHAVQAY